MLLLGFELEEKDRLRECGGANALRGQEQLPLAVGVSAVRHPEDLHSTWAVGEHKHNSPITDPEPPLLRTTMEFADISAAGVSELTESYFGSTGAWRAPRA